MSGNQKQDNQSKVNLEPAQLAPHSQEAEEALLGSVLMNPNVFPQVASFLKADDFFLLQNGWVWEAMERLAERHEDIEMLTVGAELQTQQNRLQDIGGFARLTYLSSNTPTSMNAEAYGRIVERNAIRRRMLQASTEITRLAREEDLDTLTVYEKGREIYDGIGTQRFSATGIQSFQQASSAFYDHVEALMVGKGLGIPSGFIDLDKLINGWFRGDLEILAGRPGMGKTTLQVNMLMHAAKAGMECAFFSLEMSTREIMARIFAAETGIDSTKFRKGGLTSADQAAVIAVQERLKDVKMFIDDTPAQRMSQIRAKCLALKAQGRLKMVFLDYLQKIGMDDPKMDRFEHVRRTAENAKNLAKELDVPVLMAAQLNRDASGKKPELQHLAESGNIEREADVIMMIHREDVYDKNSQRKNLADLEVIKHRHGPTGEVELFFHGSQNRFTNVKKTPIHLADIA